MRHRTRYGGASAADSHRLPSPQASGADRMAWDGLPHERESFITPAM
jgi:hypothetical protein